MPTRHACDSECVPTRMLVTRECVPPHRFRVRAAVTVDSESAIRLGRKPILGGAGGSRTMSCLIERNTVTVPETSHGDESRRQRRGQRIVTQPAAAGDPACCWWHRVYKRQVAASLRRPVGSHRARTSLCSTTASSTFRDPDDSDDSDTANRHSLTACRGRGQAPATWRQDTVAASMADRAAAQPRLAAHYGGPAS
jgi:hypothetical protein